MVENSDGSEIYNTHVIKIRVNGYQIVDVIPGMVRFGE